MNDTREELLALTPAHYLADGYVDPEGAERPEFQGAYAHAACLQFFDAGLSPNDFTALAGALRAALPRFTGTPYERANQAAMAAQHATPHAEPKDAADALTRWLTDCAAAVHTETDLHVFLAHLQAIEAHYPTLAAAPSGGPANAVSA
jgi:hypothetical protein